jgi:hypothetical protein
MSYLHDFLANQTATWRDRAIWSMMMNCVLATISIVLAMMLFARG